MIQAPPQPKYVPFKGPGHTLGTKTTESSEDVVTSMNTSDAVPRPSQALIIDDAKPATSIQALQHPLYLPLVLICLHYSYMENIYFIC